MKDVTQVANVQEQFQ